MDSFGVVWVFAYWAGLFPPFSFLLMEGLSQRWAAIMRGGSPGRALGVAQALAREWVPVGYKWTYVTPAEGGHLGVHIQRFLTCARAAGGGHLHVLKYAHENGCPWNEETCASAAREGHLNVLKYAHEKGCPWYERSMCLYAAMGGNLAVLKYAHENSFPWDQYTCSSAAAGGHLDVLKYAREQDCPWNRLHCRQNASDNRHHHVVAWIDAQPLE